jgi:WD40 repeat protein
MPKEKQKEPKPEHDEKLDLLKEIKVRSSVLGLDSTEDGKTFFGACMDGGVYQIDRQSEKAERLLKHESYASGVWYLRKSKVLISAGYDGALQWYDLEKRQLLRKVQAHRFWSWQMAVSPNESLVASVTGQYLAGGYKYEPAAEQEPSVRVYDANTGRLKHSFAHVPPVLSVAFSPDNHHLAAANMMGEIRIYDLETGKQAAVCSTPDFTSWGIIKSHHYIGGIFALAFSPDGNDILAAGMGPMTDPMAGNGKQKWQRFVWRENKKIAEISDGDRGNGLMETLWLHPSNKYFVMAGRLAQGSWNTAFFDAQSGKLLHSADTKVRVTDALFSTDGQELFLAGAVGQQKKKDGQYPEAGRIKIHKCAVG